MRAVIYQGQGDVSVLRLAEVRAPALAAKGVRIRVKASGLNRADIVQRKGFYPPPPGESEVPGLEVAGEIIEVGAEAGGVRVGDQVMALLGGGGYAEEVCVDSSLCLPIPGGMTYVQAAGVIETFVTAHHNLFFLGGAKKGDPVLVHAGASGVGTSAIQLLRELGAKPFVTVGNPDKAAFCRGLGAETIEYKRENFAQTILEKTSGAGVSVILDCVGASYLEDNLKCLSADGTLICIGTMGGREGKVDVGRLLARRHRIVGSSIRGLPLSTKREVVARFYSDCGGWLREGRVKPVIDTVFPVSDVKAAHERMESNENTGKIVLSWE